MRLKHIKGAEEAMINSPFIAQKPEENKGSWRGDYKKLAVEIGMGKGQFITQMAQANPDTMFVGIERFSSVLLRALQKQEELLLPNLKLIRMDAEKIEEIFAEEEIDEIYLNFSDPWPKDRHAKRRLTSPQFLDRYKKVLKKEGRIEFKTDNVELFNYSLEQVENSGWNIVAVTRDLHADSSMIIGNVMTEYEERFSSNGNPICKVIFMH